MNSLHGTIYLSKAGDVPCKICALYPARSLTLSPAEDFDETPFWCLETVKTTGGKASTTMYRLGHYGAALLTVAPLGGGLIAVGFAEVAVLSGAGALALAMVPDLDQRLPLVSHRGLTHTVWFALVVGAAVAGLALAILPVADIVAGSVGFLVGAGTIGSHIAADALTPAGVRPWAPLDNTSYSAEVTTAANPLANYALLGLGVAAVAVAAWLGAQV